MKRGDSPLSPNDLINAADDGRYDDAVWNAKAQVERQR
jgi:hypothetical protein